MKIVEAKVIVCCPGRNFVTLKITTDQGVYGVGDATLNGREKAVVAFLEDYLCPMLIGKDPRPIEDILQFFYRGIYWRRGAVNMTAIAYPGPQAAIAAPQVPAEPAAQAGVLDTVSRTESGVVPNADLNLGRLFLTSMLTTALVLFLGVGVPMWALTGQIWDGVGLGAFTAFWGGPGFGLMAAGAMWTARSEND